MKSLADRALKFQRQLMEVGFPLSDVPPLAAPLLEVRDLAYELRFLSQHEPQRGDQIVLFGLQFIVV